MLDREPEQLALIRCRQPRGADGDGNALQRDHLADDTGGGVDRRGQNRIQAERVGRDHLQIAEEWIRRRVAAAVSIAASVITGLALFPG